MHSPDPGLIVDLERLLGPERVLSRPIDRLSRASDASLYRMIPQAVVRPRGLGEMKDLFALLRRRRSHLTFRAAGTSLSGQAVTAGVLAEVAPFWRSSRVVDDGRRVWTQPGVVGGHLNRLLAPRQARIGPDPASIDAAMIGGIVANNSSGMCCGVAQNSYKTLDSIGALLADGTHVDSSWEDGDEQLRRARPDIHAALLAMRAEVLGDDALAARIRHKFKTKNTSGYSLNALVDYERPVDILTHLMVGSEGTLGFVAEMTLRTVPELPARATAMVFFAELQEAGAAVAPLAEAGADALEILDSASLRSIAGQHELPFEVAERNAALLMEFRRGDGELLDRAVQQAKAILGRYQLIEPPRFTTGVTERVRMWKLRKGLAATTGAMRPSGTALLTEDVAVPVARLAEAILDFQKLFERHGIPDTVIFGHAKDGNLHFVTAEDVKSASAIERYGTFVQDLVELVVHKYDGAIKAEHGSGRSMAPFVKTEWGERAYGVMQRIKSLLDPDGLLNPDVLLTDDPRLHLKNLKPSPPISPLADRCIDCGFCEARCPSRDLSLTPRQRIMVTREIAALRASQHAGDRRWAEALQADFAYDGVTTCAGDSMCQTACPVKIDTGALMKELRSAQWPRWAVRLAKLQAESFALTAAGARAALRAGSFLGRLPFGRRLLELVSALVGAVSPGLGSGLVTAHPLPLPAPPLPDPGEQGSRNAVVYFPSCLTRIVGGLPGEDLVPPAQAMFDVLRWAGHEVRLPQGIDGLCCGMAFGSKGFFDAARVAAERTAEALWQASDGGRLKVVTDASPCAGTLQESVADLLRQSGRPLVTLDFPAFWAREVLPRLEEVPRAAGTAVLHPTCTLIKEEGLPDLLAVARAHAEQVELPRFAECCGFAGDRGFLVPELTESATEAEATEIRNLLDSEPAAEVYSTCRTCEIGMTRAVGRPVRSLLHLVHEAVIRA